MVSDQRHGWLTIPGVQTGDRPLDEQMLGLDHALAEARGKSILDVGCAEGLIGREFARAGAARVMGLEILESHLEVARSQCRRFSVMRFKQRDLNVQSLPKVPAFDIVLALAVLHKLIEPAHGARYCAASARSLVVIRLPVNSVGVIAGKHSGVSCDLREEFPKHGFALERVVEGPRTELVHYWRRRMA